jgi:aryl-alcohol dehydrogenase-like predicted oxidoreductase
LLEAAVHCGVTEVDTAFSYTDFTAHKLLAAVDSVITTLLSITTKVGFFPEGHDLAPTRLSAAAHQIADDLGRPPDTLLLHNPERSAPMFTRACEELIRLRDAGLCGAWGISTWDPGALLGRDVPGPPDVMMVRCGLTVPARVLAASERLIKELQPHEVRGMSPFGGSASGPIWGKVEPARFLNPASRAKEPNRIQSAFAVAFAVPQVSAVAAGAHDADHLGQLCDATDLRADPDTVASYRALLAERRTLPSMEPANVGESART